MAICKGLRYLYIYWHKFLITKTLVGCISTISESRGRVWRPRALRSWLWLHRNCIAETRMHTCRSVMLWCFILSLDVGKEIFCRPSSRIRDVTEQSEDNYVDMLKYKLPEVWWSHALDDKQLTSKRSWYVIPFVQTSFDLTFWTNLRSFWLSIIFEEARLRSLTNLLIYLCQLLLLGLLLSILWNLIQNLTSMWGHGSEGVRGARGDCMERGTRSICDNVVQCNAMQ